MTLLGSSFSGSLPFRSVVLLYGEMGSGKTAFCRGVGAGLGVRTRMTSPSFVTIKEYQCAWGEVVHCDLYRVEDVHYLEENGIWDKGESSNLVVLVEWAEKLDKDTVERAIFIEMSRGRDNAERKVSIVSDMDLDLEFSYSFNRIDG